MILAAQTAGGGMSSMLIMMVVLFGLMYFMMIRPQRKEQKRMQEMLSAMAIGDAVVTTGGFYGIIIDITENDVIVEFGNNKNCRIPMRKEAIAQVEKPEQAAAALEAQKEKEKSGAAEEPEKKGLFGKLKK